MTNIEEIRAAQDAGVLAGMPADAFDNPWIAWIYRQTPSGQQALRRHLRDDACDDDFKEFILGKAPGRGGRIRAMNHAAAPAVTLPPATWRGRSFAELKPVERLELKRTDLAFYNRMRSAWCRANGFPETMERTVRFGGRVIQKSGAASKALVTGQRYEQLRPMERHVLKRDNPTAFDALRGDWVKRGGPVE